MPEEVRSHNCHVSNVLINVLKETIKIEHKTDA